MTHSAEEIAARIQQEFGTERKHLSVAEVEDFMRPFGVITRETEYQIEALLRPHDIHILHLGISAWIEANEVVSGSGPSVERRIQFLLLDTCTCVLDHLPAAIKNATKEVDPRVQNLLSHPYLQK